MKYNKETRETRHVTVFNSPTPKTLLDRFSRFLLDLGLRNLVLGAQCLLEVGGWEAISLRVRVAGCRWPVAGGWETNSSALMGGWAVRSVMVTLYTEYRLQHQTWFWIRHLSGKELM
jgi:hypothetical protein